MDFKDNFSRQAAIYAKARPTYPKELFDYLASLCAKRDVCWDCATGNGQAAVSLANYFAKVIATDGSGEQLKHAMPALNIEYRMATAEESGLPDNSVDLITAATAAHWFNHELFYKEVVRVAKPNAIVAVWAYQEATVTPEIDKLMKWFMYDFLADYWPPGRWYIRDSYRNLPFPFKALPTPDFFCRFNWDKEQWLNYIRSWSSYNNYVRQHSSDPLKVLAAKLDPLWQDKDTRQVTWRLHLKCAPVHAANKL